MELVYWYYTVLCGVLVLVPSVSSTCSASRTSTWVSINETVYDRVYTQTSIQEPGKRVLGFNKDIVYYNQDGVNQSNPCVTVTGATGKMIEIMIEPEPPARICVRDQTGNINLCGLNTVYSCIETTADTMVFEFYCDSSCQENDVNFWYRFTLSPPPSEMDPEMWCFQRNSGEFPSSLLPINSNADIKTTPKVASKAATLSTPAVQALTFLILIILFLLKY